MPRRNLSVLSKEEDPYRLQRYPVAFQVMLSNGKQAHNARELVKAARFKGQWLDMARQPIPAAKVREILALTGQRPRAATGRLVPASQLAKLRKLAKRELLARQGKRVVGPMAYEVRGTAAPSTPDFFQDGGYFVRDAHDWSVHARSMSGTTLYRAFQFARFHAARQRALGRAGVPSNTNAVGLLAYARLYTALPHPLPPSILPPWRSVGRGAP